MIEGAQSNNLRMVILVTVLFESHVGSHNLAAIELGPGYIFKGIDLGTNGVGDQFTFKGCQNLGLFSACQRTTLGLQDGHGCFNAFQIVASTDPFGTSVCFSRADVKIVFINWGDVGGK